MKRHYQAQHGRRLGDGGTAQKTVRNLAAEDTDLNGYSRSRQQVKSQQRGASAGRHVVVNVKDMLSKPTVGTRGVSSREQTLSLVGRRAPTSTSNGQEAHRKSANATAATLCEELPVV